MQLWQSLSFGAMTVLNRPPAAPASPTRTRRRLPPQTRIPLILDAALAAFSVQGYADTRIDDIAREAGLSKGGLYAHFESKEAIFNALLQRSLVLPSLDVAAVLNGARTAHEVVRRLLEPMYETVQQPAVLAMARILLTEGHRLPPQAQEWRLHVQAALWDQLSEVLAQGSAQGLLRPSATAHAPWLLLAPFTHWIVQRLCARPGEFLDAGSACAGHVAMLTELLTP